jgi:hypothetical protein
MLTQAKQAERDERKRSKEGKEEGALLEEDNTGGAGPDECAIRPSTNLHKLPAVCAHSTTAQQVHAAPPSRPRLPAPASRPAAMQT